MSQTFTHLHLHSQYSLLDGAIRLKDLYPRLHEFGMKSVALTDHGNMFGALDFYKSARANDIKPIFGCEIYITDRDMRDRSERRSFGGHPIIAHARFQRGGRDQARGLAGDGEATLALGRAVE